MPTFGALLPSHWMAVLLMAMAAPAAPDSLAYQPSWVVVEDRGGASNESEQAERLLGQFGRFERWAVGETLDLAALRLGVGVETLRLLNPGFEQRQVPFLCLDRRHLCLPADTLESVAAGYRCEVEVLRTLNDLGDGEQPSSWDEISVPAVFGKRGGKAALAFPAIQWTVPAVPGVLEMSLREEGLVVTEGQGWEALAETAACSVELLRRVNEIEGPAADARPADTLAEQAEQDSLAPEGRRLMVGFQWLPPEVLPFLERVHFALVTLGVPLAALLKQNGVEAAEELRELEVWRLPLCQGTGLRGLDFAGQFRPLTLAPGVIGTGISRVNNGRSTGTTYVLYLNQR